jgi:hypothetical protein
MSGHRRFQIIQMPPASQVVEDHSGERNPLVKIFEPLDQRSRAARHAGRVDHQQYRQVQPFGHLGRGAGLIVAAETVEQSHDPFDYGNIAVTAMAPERLKVVSPVEHPAVQVAAGAARHPGMVPRIDEIRSDLKGCHGQSPAPQGCHQAEGDSGFPDPAMGAGYDEAFVDDMLLSIGRRMWLT